MENLEHLKDLWQNQGNSAITFTSDDIQGMVQKRSTSIVKWILIISILEFILPNLILFFTDLDASKRIYAEYGLNNVITYYTIVHVAIIIAFIYVFYRNYRRISADSSVRDLLKDILRTRSTVKYYIYYNLTMMGIIGIHVFYIVFSSNRFSDKLPEDTSMLLIWTIAIVLFAFVLFVFWCFYRLLYGILLKKLKRNYNELQKGH